MNRLATRTLCVRVASPPFSPFFLRLFPRYNICIPSSEKKHIQKDFDKWNEKKKQIDAKGCGPFFHEREIWWSSLGFNVGFEQDGKGEKFGRPVLVFKQENYSEIQKAVIRLCSA